MLSYTGPADVLQLLGCTQDALDRQLLVELLGYKHKSDKPVAKAAAAADKAANGKADAASQKLPNSSQTESSPQQHQAATFYGVKPIPAAPPHADTIATAEPLADADLQRQPAPVPTLLPLLPWARLWPQLRAQLSQSQASSHLDLKETVRQLAKAKPLRRLPRQQLRHWGQPLYVLAERTPSLQPLHQDQQWLLSQLRRLRGDDGLQAYGLLTEDIGSPTQLCKNLLLGHEAAHALEKGCPLPPVGAQVLLLTDLGAYDRASKACRAMAWQAYIHKLQQRGCQLLMVNPAPVSLWPAWSVGLCQLHWGEGGGKPCKAVPEAQIFGHTHQRAQRQATQLLNHLGFCLQIEPALLRQVRVQRQLPVAAELYAWHAPNVSNSSTALVFRPAARAKVRGNYQTLARKHPKRMAAIEQLANTHHQHWSRVLQTEEQLYSQLLRNANTRQTEQFYLRLAAHQQQAMQGNTGLVSEVSDYMQAMTHRAPSQTWANAALAQAYISTNAQRLRQDARCAPKTLNLAAVQHLLQQQQLPNQRYQFRWQQDQLRFVRADSATSRGRLGLQPAVAEWSACLPLIDVHSAAGQSSYQLGDVIPTKSQTLQVSTGGDDFELHAITKTATDFSMGHDAQGLFRQRSVDATRQYFPWPTDPPPPNIPTWATAHGQDQYGYWAEFNVAKVVQRMRWIAPGDFLMGSPTSEARRDDDEAQHPVTISQGFWLADTACTQALWQAVMRDNPSRFEAAQRPVEQVRYKDVQGFLAELREHYQLPATLPTEAQWEYACRAGTDTPFSFGEQISTEQVNYDGNYPYQGGAKGEYRQQTVAVKALPANAWGLYQMHGNVREWCADWYGAYEFEPDMALVDPLGPESGSSRVVRGGGWCFDALRCGSAYRFDWAPGFRGVDLGFRFTCGQDDSGAH